MAKIVEKTLEEVEDRKNRKDRKNKDDREEIEYCIKENWTEKVLILTQRQGKQNLSGYQVTMLRENKVKWLLPVEIIRMNQTWLWQYEIKDKICWRDWTQNHLMKKQELRIFFQCFYAMLEKMEEHLLNIDTLILNPSFIFKDEKKYYFCCYPPVKEELKIQMEKLHDFITEIIDVKDRETVQYTYEMIERYRKGNLSNY